MLIHEFDELMEAEPFRPFRIYTADGRAVLVRGPRYAWHAPADRTIFVATGSGNTLRKHIIDLHLVSRFTMVKRRGEGGHGNGNGKAKKPK
jgi:hypothetical protein